MRHSRDFRDYHVVWRPPPAESLLGSPEGFMALSRPCGPLLGSRLDLHWILIASTAFPAGPLLDLYGTSAGPLWDLCQTSNGSLLDLDCTSNGPRLDLNRTSTGHLQHLYWTSTGPLLGF